MPTDHPTAEAMALLDAHVWFKAAPETKALLRPIRSRAEAILSALGDCPGFWGEVLAAVRVLGGDAACEPAAILAALRAVVGAA